VKSAPLDSVLASLTSGGRPKGGVSAHSGEITSIGGEHLTADGRFDFTNIKRIPRSFFAQMRGGRIAPLDILVVKDGATTGKIALVDDDFPFGEAAVNEHVFCARVDPQLASPRYVCHYLRSPQGQSRILSDFRGATVGGISRGFAAKTLVPLPPLAVQRRIADILDWADALRAKRRAVIARWDGLGRAIFVSVFGDPSTNPQGWPKAPLAECCTQVTDGEHLTPLRTASGVKLLSARNVRDGFLDFANVDFIGPAEYERIRRRCEPVRGDVLISCSGSIGRVAPVETDEPFALVRSAALVRPDLSAVRTGFLHYMLRTPPVQRQMARSANASSQANLFQRQIRELSIFRPPLDLQDEFGEQVALVDEQRARQDASLAKLDTLFASLQQRAFRGEL
jgi:type I restriction enzyme, S subunit